ncbi:MAG: hypothetical protein C0409_15215, partial [Novosphingobium sp.]|nr:hypothetical protein [Novosphingobium sp.]
PRLFILRNKLRWTFVVPPELRAAAMADLYAQRIEQDPAWPDAATQAAWDKEGGGALFHATGTPLATVLAGFDAGFQPKADEHHTPHYFYYAAGEPRFAQHVAHPIRLGVGQELHQYLKDGMGYDETGEYTQKCLDQGPSFVIEINGQICCASCTHLSGSMGMIYTPPEHRRNGYGRSLAAFQIDYMLRTKGEAFCHVNEQNEASWANLDKIGMPRLPEALTWRTLIWQGQ